MFSATNRATVRGVTVLNQTDDKSRSLNRHNLLIFAGESGDTIQFAEYVQANVQLYGMKNDTELNSDAVAAFTRREMADNLRTRVPFPVLWKHVLCVRLLLFPAVFWVGGLGAG
jgi:20S proteasome subunit beta 4